MSLRLPQGVLKHGLVPVAYYFLRSYLSLIRVKVENEDVLLDHLDAGGKGIAAVWHQRFLSALVYASKYRSFKPCVMISKSRDGDLIAPIAARLGLIPVRGSSSRGGRSALHVMVNEILHNVGAVHIVDGPRGPKGVVKRGIVKMAQLANVPIFPLYISVQKAWVTASWDRFLVPKPFSRVSIRWGEPIYVPSKSDPEIFEDIRKTVEEKLLEGHARDDLGWGWDKPL